MWFEMAIAKSDCVKALHTATHINANDCRGRLFQDVRTAQSLDPKNTRVTFGHPCSLALQTTNIMVWPLPAVWRILADHLRRV